MVVNDYDLSFMGEFADDSYNAYNVRYDDGQIVRVYENHSLLITQENYDTIIGQSEGNLISAQDFKLMNINQNSFEKLQNQMKPNEIISLEHDYSYFGGDNVVISCDNVTIEGNGHIINGNNLAGLIVSGDNVVLNNITIVNCTAGKGAVH